MKRKLLKLSTACIALIISGSAMAQKSVDIKTVSTPPTIDGAIDAMWDAVPANAIDVPFATEVVSVGDGSIWKAVWDNDNIYVLVISTDDDYYPTMESGEATWSSDQIELYFDVNANKVDGGGPGSSTNTAGHFQIAPAQNATGEGYTFSVSVDVDSANWQVEYSIPFALLLDENGVALDPKTRTTIGYDVTILDLDEEGKGGNPELGRINWNNDVSIDESWNTLDYSGDLNFIDAPAVGIKNSVAKTNILASTVVNKEVKINVAIKDITILNSIGQIVKTSKSQIVNVADLNNGVYILSAKTAKGEVVTNRFIKQ